MTEGVNIAINNELPAAERFLATADLRGALRKFPEQNAFAKIKDGTSNTILVAECAVEKMSGAAANGNRLWPTRHNRLVPVLAAAPGPQTTIRLKSARVWSGVQVRQFLGRCASTIRTSMGICSTASIRTEPTLPWSMGPYSSITRPRDCAYWLSSSHAVARRAMSFPIDVRG